MILLFNVLSINSHLEYSWKLLNAAAWQVSRLKHFELEAIIYCCLGFVTKSRCYWSFVFFSDFTHSFRFLATRLADVSEGLNKSVFHLEGNGKQWWWLCLLLILSHVFLLRSRTFILTKGEKKAMVTWNENTFKCRWTVVSRIFWDNHNKGQLKLATNWEIFLIIYSHNGDGLVVHK